MSNSSTEFFFQQVNQGLITSLEREQLPANEITAATEVLRVTIEQFSESDFSQLADVQKKYVTIANMVKEDTLQRLFREDAPENITVTMLPSPVIQENHTLKTITQISAGILGGVLVFSGPIGWGALALGTVSYVAYKNY